MIVLKRKPLSELFTPKKILLALTLFLLVFPKGGIKLGGIPLTWGYLLLVGLSVILLMQKQFQIQTSRLQALLLLLPFQLIAAMTILINGVEGVGFTFSLFLSFFFFPSLFFLLLSPALEKMDLTYFSSLIKKGVFFVSVYGIFLFFFKLTTGKLIEIPFLTINFHDIGEIEGKCNNRGAIFKLISTYNNGNIFGICILIFLSFYSYVETARWRRYIVRLALFLTFSRTVWVGLIFSEMASEYFVKQSKRLFFFKIIAIPLSIITLIVGAAFIAGFDYHFFLDSTLGGRITQLQTIPSFSFLSDRPFNDVLEIVYLGILEHFGLLGLIAYLAAMLGPLFLIFAHHKTISPMRGSLLCGLLTYLFVSASDGALLFIPVLAFYWFCASLALRYKI